MVEYKCSTNVFKFGDGKKVGSLKQATISAVIGSKKISIETFFAKLHSRIKIISFIKSLVFPASNLSCQPSSYLDTSTYTLLVMKATNYHF